MFHSNNEGINSDPLMCAILAPFFMQPKIPIADEARGQNIFGLTYENMNQLTVKSAWLPRGTLKTTCGLF